MILQDLTPLILYKQAKGSVQFPIDKPIPFDIVKKIVEFRVKENEARIKNKKISTTKPKGPFCQSCAMPMQKPDDFGTNADVSKNEEYCHYCFINVEREYTRCITALNRTGILTLLPKSESIGVIGIDGKEYPIPTQEQVVELFDHNRELVGRKVPQGFDRLELTPMAMPTPHLIALMKAAILKHAAEGKIYQTRRSPSDPVIPVRVNTEKHVWIWDTLRQALDTDELVYFPQEYSSNHRGQTKLEVVNNGRICAVPGWSVGLVESLPIMPQQDQGQTLGGRRQLEIGYSPREYLQTLQSQAYQGETGKTLEDFITKFLTHLETTNEVSNDRYDNNALWFLGQYVKYVKHVKSDLVPTGWWHRDFGRARLDAHRPGNRLCTRSWGGSSTVRLLKP